MDWTRGYTAEWDVRRVNPDTWADEGSVAGIGSISVTRTRDDSVRLLETASMEVEDALDTGWYRLYLVAKQGGTERFPLATMLFEQIKSRSDHGKVATARGRSVLQPAADIKFYRGCYTPSGTDAAKWCATAISQCIPAPVHVAGEFALSEDKNHAPGTSVLKAVWDVLDAGGFCMRISGTGEVTIGPLPTEAALRLDKANAGLLVPGVDDDFDLTDVPNRYIAVFDGGEVFVATNEDETSTVGYPQRGRWVDADTDTSPSPLAGESRQAYVERRLRELSTVTRRFSYTREYWPDCVPYDLVSASLADNGVDGELRIVSQSITRGNGAVVSEVAGKEVTL